MRRLNHILGGWRRWILVLGALGCVVCVAGGSSVALAQCVPPLTSCPPPSPAPTEEPVVQVTAPVDVRDTTATLTGTINPGGLATTYRWSYSYDGLLTGTEEQSLPAGTTTVPVRLPVSGLRPGTTYQLWLTAWNAKGTTDDQEMPVEFATPEHPRLRLLVRRSYFVFGQPYQVTVKASGTYDSLASVRLYVAKYPYRHWREADGDPAPRYHGHSVTLQPCFTVRILGCADPDRNFKIRAVLGPATSNTRRIDVLPSLALTTQREQDGASPWVDATLYALVHEMKGHYPTARVFFYTASTRRGPFTRVGSARLHVAHRSGIAGTQLAALLRIRSPAAVVVRACLRRRLVSDMGTLFLARWCGGETLG